MKENYKTNYIYYICDGENIKCGISVDVKRRLKQLQTSNAKRLYLLGYHIGNNEDEKYVHSKFYKVRGNGEWMKVTDDLLEYINSKLSDVYVDRFEGKLRSFIKIKK